METRETVTVPGTLEGVAGGARAFDAFIEARGLPEAARWRFQVALDEVLSNIVRHGHAQNAQKGGDETQALRRSDHAEAAERTRGRGEDADTIDSAFTFDAEVLTVEVTDRAPAFDPLQAAVPDTTAALDDRRPGGLGITLVGALMDAVRYERRGHCNHLTMTWRVRDDVAPPPAGNTQ